MSHQDSILGLPDLSIEHVKRGQIVEVWCKPKVRPADLYQPSNRKYEGLPDVVYPFHNMTVTVTTCGRICLDNKKIHLSTVFAGQDVGLRQVEEEVWLVSFMDYDIGYFDMESRKVSAIENPFGPNVIGMLSDECKVCARYIV